MKKRRKKENGRRKSEVKGKINVKRKIKGKMGTLTIKNQQFVRWGKI
jgi:hypothetical protein